LTKYKSPDDILQGIDYKEGVRGQVSDSEIILTAIVSCTIFYGNNKSAIQFVKQYGLFEIVSSYFKDSCCEIQYINYSFPVPLCNNMRSFNCKTNGEVTKQV
jgi:hypothetical protein